MLWCRATPIANNSYLGKLPVDVFISPGDVPTIKAYLDKVRSVTQCDGCSEQDERRWASRKEELHTIRGYFAHIGPGMAKRLGHSLQAFLLECKLKIFAGVGSKLVNCSDNDVRVNQLVTSEHFTCFVFSLQNQTFQNAKMGLELVLHLDNYVYENQVNPNLRTTAGVIVYSVMNGKVSNSAGVEIPAGYSSQMKITLTGKERLRYPHGRCMTEETKPEFMRHHAVRYTRHACSLFCVNEGVQDICNCTDTSFPAVFLTGNEPQYCKSLNQSREDLANKMDCASREKLSQYIKCTSEVCDYKCSSVEPEVDVSYSKWPTTNHLPFFYQKYIHGRPHQKRYKDFSPGNWKNFSEGDILLSQRLVDENFLRISFYLNSYTYLVLSEVPQLTLSSFASQLGGALNMWSGITVVVVIEVVELFVRLVSPEAEQKKHSETNGGKK